MNELIIMGIILFFIYIAVLLFILAGRWGDKLKRTADKIARYYNVLLALTVVDGLQLVSIWYVNLYGGHSIIMFPWVTLLGAFGIAGIEVKSMLEGIEDKEKKDAQEMFKLLVGVLKNSSNPEAVVEKVEEFIEESKNEKDEQRTNKQQSAEYQAEQHPMAGACRGAE